MSRVGKHKVVCPPSVKYERVGNILKVSGKHGNDSITLPDCIFAEDVHDGVIFSSIEKTKRSLSMWGTVQRNFFNLVKGVSEGFTVNLDLVGVGYRAAVQGTKLIMHLGFSHKIEYDIPIGVTIKCDKPTSISVFGSSKQLVGQVAAVLREYRKPEPYKGKGIIRSNEFVVRKERKKK